MAVVLVCAKALAPAAARTAASSSSAAERMLAAVYALSSAALFATQNSQSEAVGLVEGSDFRSSPLAVGTQDTFAE